MSWEEFKKMVDERLKQSEIKGEEIQIDWIDIGTFDEPDITISEGSDGRISLQVTD